MRPLTNRRIDRPQQPEQLAQAGVLVTAKGLDQRRREGEEQIQLARTRFVEHRYCELPSLVHPAHTDALSRYFGDHDPHAICFGVRPPWDHAPNKFEAICKLTEG